MKNELQRISTQQSFKRNELEQRQKREHTPNLQPLPPIPLHRRADKERICSRPYPKSLPRTTNQNSEKIAQKNSQYTQQKRQILDANRFIKKKLHTTNGSPPFSSVLSKLSHKYSKKSLESHRHLTKSNGLTYVSNEQAKAKDGDHFQCDFFVSKNVDECLALLRNIDDIQNLFE